MVFRINIKPVSDNQLIIKNIQPKGGMVEGKEGTANPNRLKWPKEDVPHWTLKLIPLSESISDP